MDKTSESFEIYIDAGIDTGSLTLLNDGRFVDSLRNGFSNSKSEEILNDIELFLSEKRIKKNRLKKIVFSRGFGSVTGDRIFYSTVKGLGDALSLKVREVSFFEALYRFSKLAGNVSVLLYSETRKVFYYRNFGMIEGIEVCSMTVEELKKEMNFKQSGFGVFKDADFFVIRGILREEFEMISEASDDMLKVFEINSPGSEVIASVFA